MASFTTCVRHQKSNGLYPIYIRVYHKNELHYINTGLLVNEKGLKAVYNKNGKKQYDVSDRIVLRKCMDTISKYVEKMNLADVENMDCKTFINYITDKDVDLSFTEYAKEHVRKMKKNGKEATAELYELAVRKLKEHMQKDTFFSKN